VAMSVTAVTARRAAAGIVVIVAVIRIRMGRVVGAVLVGHLGRVTSGRILASLH